MLMNWAARRFDWRKQAMSRPAKAMSRGPACPVGTPSGNAPQVEQPQEQTRRCRWYSLTIGLISGSSQTWWRSGWGSTPVNAWPQRRHALGTSGITAAHSSTGDQWTGVLVVSRLTAALAFGLGFPGCGLVVRMRGRRRLGRIRGRLALRLGELDFEFGNASRQLGDLGLQTIDLVALPEQIRNDRRRRCRQVDFRK